jgi:cytochrome c-type biogenesis protein CcsB
VSRFALEVALHWAAVGGYVAATALLAYGILFARPRGHRLGTLAAALALVPHGAAIAVRWLAAGHGPYMMKYEVLSSNAWIAAAMLLVCLWRWPALAPAALVALPCIFLSLAFGLFANPEIRNLPPTLRSVWLVFHVLFNKLAAGAFLLSVATAVLLLLKQRGRRGPLIDRLPDPAALEAYTVRFIGFGLIFWTITIAAGAIWANQSWGRYWGWDPIETWALITWLAYGIFLHVRFFFKLRPAAVAWGAIACFGVCVLTVFILPFVIPSLHSAYFQ